jgi:carbon starvation protein
VLDPGTYFAINAPAAALGTTIDSAAQAIQGWGFTLDAAEFARLTEQIGEGSLLSRTGGAPSLAVGMAHLFSRALGGDGALALWYHFAIMFEALFILTTLDAGTRVGRFLLQDLGKHVWAPFGRIDWYPAVMLASALFVGAWGYFLYQGVTDPLGGINSLWPLFGIANQLLATVALCVGTTVIVRMGRSRYLFVTLVPMVWLVTVTTTAALTKIFDPNPRIGFLAHARSFADALAQGTLPKGAKSVEAAQVMIFNDRLDAAVAAFFLVAVWVIVIASIWEWWKVIGGRRPAVSTEIPFTSRATVRTAAAYAQELAARPDCPARGHVCTLPSVEQLEQFEADLLDRTVRRVVERPVGGPNAVRCC